MKTIFTLLATFLMGVSVFAAPSKTSMITVRSLTNGDIRVVLDGKRFESDRNTISLDNIGEGRHSIAIYQERSGGIFNLNGRGYQLVHSTTVNVKKNTNLVITVERNNVVNKQEIKLKGNQRNGRDRIFDYDRDGAWGDYDYNSGYAGVMTSGEFSRVLQSIDKEWLESNKLKSALNVVKNNMLTANQVKELALLFSFENNKLEVAKQAYGNTVDKRNYDDVMNVLTFASSRNDLERYIRTYR